MLFNANGQTYETLSRYAQRVDLDGIPVQTVNLEGLLLTKQRSREQDIGDRRILERALQLLRKDPKTRESP